MTDDMFDWERKINKYPVGVVLVLQTIIPDDQMHTRTGFVDEGGIDVNGIRQLSLPEEPLWEQSLASDQIIKMASVYIDTDPRWAQKTFVAFFDSIGSSLEQPRIIRLVYKVTVPENVTVSDKLVWKTHNEISQPNCRIIGDHDRIFTTAYNQ